MKMYKRFFENELWIEAFELQKIVFELSCKFPNEEKYGLRSQIDNSSNSIMANLAEEHGRFYYLDKVRVLYIVRGEIEETQSHLICATSRCYIQPKDIVSIMNRYDNLKKRLNGRINDFKRKKEDS